MNRGRLGASVSIGLIGCSIIAMMLIYPNEALAAALKGISIWWDVLFPALFPFFVISEMMFGFGVVHFFGTLLDPLMRPLFRVPGIGGFVMAMGFASGYPVGSRLTAQLWDEGLVTREEGERLVAFTTTSDPIFLIGAVSIGFFGDVTLAPILAIGHYGAAVLVGLIMRFHAGGKMGEADSRSKAAGTGLNRSEKPDQQVLIRALRSMHKARLGDNRALGTVLSEAIESSLRLIIVVGGLVVFFSVVIEALTLLGAMDVIVAATGRVLSAFGMPEPLSEAVVNGIFEVTLGVRSAGTADAAFLLQDKAAIGALGLSWAGLSVHAQVLSIVSRTGFRYLPFLFARLLHAALSCTIVYAFWQPLQALRGSMPAWTGEGAALRDWLWTWTVPFGITVFLAVVGALLLLSISLSLAGRSMKK